MIIKKVLIKK